MTKLENYVTTNRFYVEITSVIAASFSECSGLGVRVKKEIYYEGGANDQQRIRLGHAEFSDVTLKRGLTDDTYFWRWASQIFSNGIQTCKRRNVNILTFNQAGDIMQSWTLIGAVPVAWQAPAMQADGSTVAIEELTLAYEGINVGKSSGGGEEVIRRSRDYAYPSS